MQEKRIAKGLKKKFPNISRSYYVCIDTLGSIATAFPNGKSIGNDSNPSFTWKRFMFMCSWFFIILQVEW